VRTIEVALKNSTAFFAVPKFPASFFRLSSQAADNAAEKDAR
jgi:hypothetical protein